MLSVAPGVTHVATSKTSNAFVVEGDAGLILVDGGLAKGVGALLKAIEELGRRPADVTGIVITHAHPDHVQAVPELRARTGARVLIHRADAAWLPAGRVPAGCRSGVLARGLDNLPLGRWTPFEADEVLEDGDLVEGSGGLRVVHTPGHTPGHIVLLHEPAGAALVGDALFRGSKLGLGPAMFSFDPAARAGALSRIPADVRAVGFGHGDPLTGAEVDLFRAFLDQQR
ncbi:MBL fold metallo-hydrolase [Kitasatospora sp. NBC_01287]|uniref:MBL fold metallo-hydrolase n=1 Tax=Kitasatospora sp. NBC_01287 TaxID=2903573 RepID=UPI00225BCC4C|nr:MBL fold metallo-hydrolase [Kitasatospora sp. NBC_01287]MCX4745451.1 MBL fold metallo-hydrolase [Kitasatospora sp. NBC_01287]